MTSPKTKIRVQYYNPEFLFVAIIFSVILGISVSLVYPYKKIVTLILGSIIAIACISHLLFDPKNGLLGKPKKRDEK